MNIHEHAAEKVGLAQSYAEDGAFLSSARVLRGLADDLEAHHTLATMDFEPVRKYRMPVVRVSDYGTVIFTLSFTTEGEPVNPPEAATKVILDAAWAAWTAEA